MDGDVLNVVVTGLMSFTNYSFFVSVCNSVGCVNSSVASAFTLSSGTARQLSNTVSNDQLTLAWPCLLVLTAFVQFGSFCLIIFHFSHHYLYACFEGNFSDVLTMSRLVQVVHDRRTDRQTDRQTDGRTDGRSTVIYVALWSSG